MKLFFNSKKELAKLERMQEHCKTWYRTIETSGNDLITLLALHKELWKAGLHHPNFGPNSSGIFRTKKIETMKADEVYLGNIYGIWTNNIPFFEQAQIKYDNRNRKTDTYEIICRQYKNHILSNIRAMESKIFDSGYNRDRICIALKDEIQELTGQCAQKMTILNRRMEDNKVHSVLFELSGKKAISDILIYRNHIYYPCNIEQGVNLNPKSIKDSGLYELGAEKDCQHIITCGKIKWDNEPEKLTRKDIKELHNNIIALEKKGLTYLYEN